MKLKLKYLFTGIYFLSSWTLVYCAISPKKEYSSAIPNPLCQPSDYFRYPKSVDDVVKIVKEAISKGKKVKAFGARHSATDIICTEGIPIDMSGLQSSKMNNDNTATFGAGVILRDATQFLKQHGRAFKTTPAFGNITIGGAIGTGAHGSTIKYNASISSQVAKMRIVDGNGVVRVISDKEELKAFKMHLGLLGIVVDVTLYTAKLYKTLAYNYVLNDNILTNGVAIDFAKQTDQISLYWFPAFHEVVVANWTIVGVERKGQDHTADHVPEMYSNFALVAAIGKEVAFGLTESTCAAANTLGYTVLHVIEFVLELALLMPVPDWVPIYANKQGTFRNPAVGYYDEMFAPVCHDKPQGLLGAACVWSQGANSIQILDNEISFALEDLPEFIKAVKDIVKKTPTAFPIQGILMRFSDASDIYMSTAYGRQTVHFEFYLWKRKDPYNHASGSLAGYQTILQTLANKFKGRSHWGKSGSVYHNSKSLDLKLDNDARNKFIAVMNKYDPKETFINNFGRRLKRKGTKVDVDPKTKTHCALLDNCFCTKNSDCGINQICSTLSGYTYRVCKTKNEIPEGSFNRTIFKPPFGVVSYLLTVVPTLIKGVLSNCSLTDAVGTVGLLLPGVLSVDNALQTVSTLVGQLDELASVQGIVGAVGEVVGGVLNG